MDKKLTVPKRMLTNWLRIPQMPQDLSAQIAYPSPNVYYFDEKRLHWASVVRAQDKTHKTKEQVFLLILAKKLSFAIFAFL